ncbi:hypothetical protein OS493_014122 [Desmophyllum pertusum]|uniref:Uncharacterized protein n=1 Tax=Desmophyllum pertusum TaxID=174260 RepID=A0A9W9ZDV9_9CNID|nr:hypothetical protein OS493_014122 [Desmophyllum pertusum]
MFVAISRGEDYESFRDAEDESQDYYANKVKEWRREQLRSMFDPMCWSRRKPRKSCYTGKRNFRKRKVSLDTEPSSQEDADRLL